MSLEGRLEALRPELARAAQKVVDEWQQDEEGIDEVFGGGGACDEVSRAMVEVVYDRLKGVDATYGSQPGNDHEWIVAYDGSEACVVDIPPGVYEVGGGYSWKKIEGAEISPGDIVIERIEADLVRDLFSEGMKMKKTLIALAEELERQGEENSGLLARALAGATEVNVGAGSVPGVVDAGGRKNTSKQAKGPSTYGELSQEDQQFVHSMSENLINLGKDRKEAWKYALNYVLRKAKSEQAKKAPKPAASGTLADQKLVWEFPPPEVMRDMYGFIAWALPQADPKYTEMGRKGEVAAARRALYTMLKVKGPKVAKIIQAKYNRAQMEGDRREMSRLRRWWKALTGVWHMSQNLMRQLNEYEKSPGYTAAPGYGETE